MHRSVPLPTPQRVPEPAPQRLRWRWSHLVEAPHRLCFSAAALLLAGAGLWWLVALLAAQRGETLAWQLPPSIVHGVLMSLGPMPLFFTGFLFTAGPRWLGIPVTSPAADTAAVRTPVVAQLSGWSLFLIAAHGTSPGLGRTLGAVGIALVALGWAGVLLRFHRLLRRSEAADKMHARALLCPGLFGSLCLWAASIALLAGEYAGLRAITFAALWGFIGGTFVVALHRMSPVFSAASPRWQDRQPLWGLWTLLGVCAVKSLQALYAWTPVLQSSLDMVAGAGVLVLAWRWARAQSLAPRLIAMLWAGWCWLGVALLLSALSTWWPLPQASLHAYTLGFLGTCLLTMVSRVSSAQAGRTVAADDATWGLFWVLQLVTLMRVGAALAESFPEAAQPLAPALLLSAAIGGTGVALSFLLRHGRWWGLPRANVHAAPVMPPTSRSRAGP